MGSGIILMLFRFPVVNLKIGISQYCFELQSCYAQFWKPETHTGYDLIHKIIQKSEIIKSETQKMKILTLNLQVNNFQLLYLRMVFTFREVPYHFENLVKVLWEANAKPKNKIKHFQVSTH